VRDRAAERKQLSCLPADHLVESARHVEAEWSPGIGLPGSGSEATTTTLIAPVAATNEPSWLIDESSAVRSALSWVENLPGDVIRATHIIVVADDLAADPIVDEAAFHPEHLVSCVVGGGVRIWSDFRIHEGGYGRLVVSANGAMPAEISRSFSEFRNSAIIVISHAWPPHCAGGLDCAR
jgi:uncharacterized membrane-anchored protein